MPAGLAFTPDCGQTAAGRLYNCPAEDEMRTALQKAIDDADYECAQDAPEDEGSGEEEPDDGESTCEDGESEEGKEGEEGADSPVEEEVGP